jgi:hypothetical protein
MGGIRLVVSGSHRFYKSQNQLRTFELSKVINWFLFGIGFRHGTIFVQQPFMGFVTIVVFEFFLAWDFRLLCYSGKVPAAGL